MLMQPRYLDTAPAARALVEDQFCVRPNEAVVITADAATDADVVQAIASAASAVGARVMTVFTQQLPFQGKLADPYVPAPLASAVAASDVWFDLTFPYLAGSTAHDHAMKAGRTRYLLLGDVDSGALGRLYAGLDMDRLFSVQTLFDDLMATRSGAPCKVSAPGGTDFTFRLGRAGGRKNRHANSPGMSTVMGSCIFYPEPESVRGVIALDAIFHEYYAHLPSPAMLHVDGEIRRIEHAIHHEAVTERSLRRAAEGKYGRVIHLTCGFHPAARFTGRSFIEDIRAVGANAIGLGVPWWEPGGGENHPDGVITRQSLWIDGEQIVKDGRIIGPPLLADAMGALE